MWWRRKVLMGIAALALSRPGHAEERVPIQSRGGMFAVPVVSFNGRRWQGVVRQQYDYSCGSAAIATLLTAHFERPTTEREAFDRMYELGDPQRIQREGFSLLEMKLYLESLGFKADGFRVGLDKVGRVGVPVIVMISIRGYKHFVVIKGLANGWVLVGDPALGKRKWSVPEFQKMLANDIIFAIHGADNVGRKYFNLKQEWAALPSAPFGRGVDRRSLSSFSTMLPAYNEFYQ